MKNTIYIDIDTERDRPILIGKGHDSVVPTSPEEAKEMIAIDIASICEGLCELIHVAGQNGYGSKEGFVAASIEQLKKLIEKDEVVTTIE
jgi:hypothetical protein